MNDDDSRYLTIEEQEARRRAALPWWKRWTEGCLGGCLTIELFAIALMAIPAWWTLG